MMNKKGQAGLNVFLTVIAMIFVIGIIIMAFALAGSQMMSVDQAFSRSGFESTVNESNYMNISVGFFDLNTTSYRSPLCSISAVYNDSADSGVLIASGNYSVSNCRVSLTANSPFANSTWNTTYNFTHELPNSISDVMNDTVVAVGSATTWFGIFITISAIVVLILLIVLIVVSLRGAGLMGGKEPGA